MVSSCRSSWRCCFQWGESRIKVAEFEYEAGVEGRDAILLQEGVSWSVLEIDRADVERGRHQPLRTANHDQRSLSPRG